MSASSSTPGGSVHVRVVRTFKFKACRHVHPEPPPFENGFYYCQFEGCRTVASHMGLSVHERMKVVDE